MTGLMATTNIAEDFKTEIPDKPRRPLSAYNLFFKDERANIINTSSSSTGLKGTQECDSFDKKAKTDIVLSNNSLGESENKTSPHRKISFSDLGKTIGLRWKQIDPESHDQYKRLASTDKLRYEREIEVYKKKLVEFKKAARKVALLKRKAEKKEAARKKRKQSEANVLSREGNDKVGTEVISPITTNYSPEKPVPLKVKSDDQNELLNHRSLDTQLIQNNQHNTMPVPSAVLTELSAERILRARVLGASLGLYPSYLAPSPSQHQLMLQAHYRALASTSSSPSIYPFVHALPNNRVNQFDFYNFHC